MDPRAKAVAFGLFLWFPVVFYLFRRLPAHRAVLVALIAGVLFLPEVRDPIISPEAPGPVPVPFLPLTKLNTVCVAVLLAALLLDSERVTAFRPAWFDVPMLVWCLSPFFSSAANEPPPDGTNPYWDGFAQARAQFVAWGVPYFLGRIYFNDLARFRELALGVVVGGVVYAPLCLFEARMSPQLHKFVYGFYQHDPSQAVRDGGFRPIVFMEHGLEVALWIVCAMLIAFGMWWSRSLGQLRVPGLAKGIPALAVFALLFVTAVLMKSGGALALGLLGLLMLLAARHVSARLALGVLMLLPLLYISGRITVSAEPTGWFRRVYHKLDLDEGEELDVLQRKALTKPMFGWASFSAEDFLDFLSQAMGKDRADSYRFRLINEDRVMDKFRRQPWFGWAGWNRVLVYVDNFDGEDPPKVVLTVIDGLWIHTLGNRGYVGLFSLYAAMLLPVVRFLWRFPQPYWAHPALAPAGATALFLCLYMIDNLSNAMFNPVFLLLTGGLSSVAALATPAAERRPAPAPAQRRPVPVGVGRT